MSNLIDNLIQLDLAVKTLSDRADSAVLDRVKQVVNQAGQRMSLSNDVTVIAIAGATGSGKSSLFNALSQSTLATVGVRRPMTEKVMAVSFGDADTTALLDWLEIGQCHQATEPALNGVVLLDLIDYDSIISTHQQEVDRLVAVVDAIFWVVDPQKYADGLLHNRYLSQLGDYGSVLTIVLNQVDRLWPAQTTAIHQDLVQLLRADGFTQPDVFEVSAITGQGVDELRRHASQIACEKRAMISRLTIDAGVQARALRAQLNSNPAGVLAQPIIDEVTSLCLELADVNQIQEATKASYKRRGAIATGWPVLSWLSRLRPDPLKKLQLVGFRSKPAEIALPRTPIRVHRVSQARIDTVMRHVFDAARKRLPDSWKRSTNLCVTQAAQPLVKAIDQAVVSTDLGITKLPTWWSLMRFIQWLILGVGLVGLAWLGINFVLVSFMSLSAWLTPKLGSLPLPTWLLIGSLVIGGLCAGLARIGVNLSAKVAAISAAKRLQQSIEAVASTIIIEPVNKELRAHDHLQEVLEAIIAASLVATIDQTA